MVLTLYDTLIKFTLMNPFEIASEKQLKKGLKSCERDFQLIKLGLSYKFASEGIPASSYEGAICGQAINYLFLENLDETIKKVTDQQKREKLKGSKEEIKKRASEMLNKDQNLRNMITYLLIYYAALRSYQYGQDEFTKTDQWARIQEIIKLCGTDKSTALDKKKFLVSYKKFL